MAPPFDHFMFRLIIKAPDGGVNEEQFENLDDLVWSKRHHLQLRHSFLKAASPIRNKLPLPLPDVIASTTAPDANDSGTEVRESSRDPPPSEQGCQMAIAGFLDRLCLALRASGLWLRYAGLQNLIPFFPWIAPHTLHHGAMRGKEGIKFCHLATMLQRLKDYLESLTQAGRGQRSRLDQMT